MWQIETETGELDVCLSEGTRRRVRRLLQHVIIHLSLRVGRGGVISASGGVILSDLVFPSRSGNGGNGGGGGSFLSYLQEQTGPGWVPGADPQAWVGSQPKKQALDSVMTSVCNAMDPSQEALLQPVKDMGHSEIIRGHFRGTQPFEKGLGFPHRVPELRAWDDMRLKCQVRR